MSVWKQYIAPVLCACCVSSVLLFAPVIDWLQELLAMKEAEVERMKTEISDLRDQNKTASAGQMQASNNSAEVPTMLQRTTTENASVHHICTDVSPRVCYSLLLVQLLNRPCSSLRQTGNLKISKHKLQV